MDTTINMLMTELIEAINSHAQPIWFDWILVVITLISIGLSFMIYKKQTQISDRQTQIMEEQNKIALFDKRFDLYIKYCNIIVLSKEVPFDFRENVQYGIGDTYYQYFNYIYFLLNDKILKENILQLNTKPTQDIYNKILGDTIYQLFLILPKHFFIFDEIELLFNLDDTTKLNVDNYKKMQIDLLNYMDTKNIDTGNQPEFEEMKEKIINIFDIIKVIDLGYIMKEQMEL